MKTLHSKNSIIRKSTALLLSYYKIFDPKRNPLGPTILANSFPKSGTHLLTQILGSFPDAGRYGTFISSLPSITYREKRIEKMLAKVDRTVPSELVSGHLFYDPAVQETINKKKIVHYFIYRDLRDVAISEAYYITHMNRWHKLHKYFNLIDSESDRIMFAITGDKDKRLPFPYPNIADRFKMYAGWLDDEKVFPLQFEQLIAQDKTAFIYKIIDHYIRQTHNEIDRNSLAEQVIQNINPAKSHTFRSGKSGRWRSQFSMEHKKIFKDIAGDLLISLEYENDTNW